MFESPIVSRDQQVELDLILCKTTHLYAKQQSEHLDDHEVRLNDVVSLKVVLFVHRLDTYISMDCGLEVSLL